MSNGGVKRLIITETPARRFFFGDRGGGDWVGGLAIGFIAVSFIL